MIHSFKITLAIPVAFAFALLLAPVAGEAQNLADRDTEEVADYVLTEAALATYRQALARVSYCNPGTDLRLAVPCRSISSTTGLSGFFASNRPGIRSTMSLVNGTAAM